MTYIFEYNDLEWDVINYKLNYFIEINQQFSMFMVTILSYMENKKRYM